ncbi:hypothetical protein IWQ60_005323 [Tieghemiomyces parasiticus]|uniref:Uncharacterized protein n=1 Tax=Tieghemiomyces parasiticus TaxID=78921 RepID=A0A9W8A763_9FUNG|nr:hypothetical protein IWQ60_005323 [Tieghemiomyces parasiticus]
MNNASISASIKGATGTALEKAGNMIGSESLVVQGLHTKSQATAEHEAAYAHVPPAVGTTTGAAASNPTNTSISTATTSAPTDYYSTNLGSVHAKYPTKLKGNANVAAGAAKETAGCALGNPHLAQAGRCQRAEGNAEYETARVQAIAEGTIEKSGGADREVVGILTGNEARGKADRLEAEAKIQMHK